MYDIMGIVSGRVSHLPMMIRESKEFESAFVYK